MLAKCAGLTADQLVERSCEPSPMSLIGLVRHMTEMERMYAHRLADGGTGLLYCTDEDPDGDFEAVTAAGPRTTWGSSASTAPGPGRSWRPRAGRHLRHAEPYTVRWVYLYLIKEYARHLGHADLLRERIDGATGE